MPALSDEQRLAVEHDDGPLIVLAGPGTGKTRVITARVAHMIRQRGVDAATVLAVTFTNKAAGELRERIGGYVERGDARAISCGTMHAFGMRLLRRFGGELGLPPELEILDTAQQRRMARELIRGHALFRSSIGRGIDTAAEQGLAVASELVSLGVRPADAAARAERVLAGLEGDRSPEARARRAELRVFIDGAKLSALMDARCLEEGTPRFDDLIRWPILLLERSALARDVMARDCKHVVVDEFQDLNATQIELLARLSPPESRGDVCVVGDDDQSIYGFRGADERAFERFDTVWGGVRTLKLTTNYRSGAPVIAASNAVIGRAGYRFAPDKAGEVGPNPPEGSSVELVRMEQALRSGAVAASMVGRMMESDPGVDLNGIAVIVRTGTELSRVQAAFEMAGIPCVSSAPDATPDDPGVVLALRWAALLVDPTDTSAARAVLTRAPFRCPSPAVGAVEQRYRAERSRFESGEGEDPGAALAWYAANAPESLREAIGRAEAMERALGEATSGMHADEALMRVIRATGAANAEELPARERSVRVRSLVGLVRFVRERLGRIGEPRDLRALLAYLDDLPDRDKAFRPAPEAVVEPGDIDEPGEGGGVRLLTAHASKGLEFDTVIVARVFPPDGFPQSKAKDPVVPEGVLDADPHGRSAHDRMMDEERRVFFVALTRAKRRAVLLAKLPKNKTTAVHYTLELRAEPGIDLIEHEERDVLTDTDADAMDALDQEGAADRTAVLAGARRSARRAAAGALDALERRDTPDPEMVRALERCADRLAMIAHVERHHEIPGWAAEAALRDEARALLERLDAGSDAPTAGMRSPLRLSYTKINAYDRCPRCFYVREVLGLPERPGPALVVGKAVHAALESFTLKWASADSEGAEPPGAEELEAETRRAFFANWPRSTEVDPGQLERAIAQTRVYFDTLHDPGAHIIEPEKKFVLPYVVDGVEHTIRGQIDRIDQLPSGGVRLIDYKTGHPKKELLKPGGTDLQLGIYAMAMLAEDEGVLEGSAGEYWLLASGERGVIPLADLKLDKVRAKIDKIVRGMLAGAFEKGSQCGGDCEFLDDAGPFDGPAAGAGDGAVESGCGL